MHIQCWAVTPVSYNSEAYLKSNINAAYKVQHLLFIYNWNMMSYFSRLPVKTAPIENGPSPKRPHFRLKRPQAKKQSVKTAP